MLVQRRRMLQVLLLLLMVVVRGKSADICDKSIDWCNPHHFIQYRVALPSYPDFISRMYHYLILTSSKNIVKGRYILSEQNKKPDGWTMTQLLGLGNFNTTLAIRNDNLYIIGFANRTGHWHVFPRFKELIPGATVLDFNEDYGSLIGGHYSLQGLLLGERATLNSVEVLSEYNEFRNGGNNQAARKAIAILCVTVCEASRFTTIYNRIRIGWFRGIYLNRKQAHLVVNWRVMSCALLHWGETGNWGIDGSEKDEAVILKNDFAIEHPERVVTILKLVIWPRYCHVPVSRTKYKNK